MMPPQSDRLRGRKSIKRQFDTCSDRSPVQGGVYVASGAVRSHRNPQVSHPPFGLPARSWMPPGLREKCTQVSNRRTPHPCWMRRSVFRSRPDTTEPSFNRQTSTPQTGTRVGSSAQSLVFPFLRQRCQGVGWIHPVNTRQQKIHGLSPSVRNHS